MSHHKEKINTLLTQLEDTFYNNIDNGLIQHPDLCSFASNMENIIIAIKHSLEQITPTETHNFYTPSNIDYAQLQTLATTS